MSWKPGFRAKATAGFGAMLVAMVVVASVATIGSRRSARDATRAAKFEADGLLLMQRLRFRLERMVADGRGYLLFGEENLLAREQASWAEVEATLQLLDERVTSPTGRTQLRRVAAAAGGYRAVMKHAIAERKKEPDLDVLRNFEHGLLTERDEIDAAVDQLWAEEVRSLERGLESITKSAARGSTLIVLTATIALLLSLVLARILVRELAGLYDRAEDAARRAQAALGARDELLAVIAHDLRSPLSAILMKAALIRKRAARAEDWAGLGKQVETIESTALRMEYLIRSLLDAATIEAGRLSVAPGPCDAKDLVQMTFDMLEPLAIPKSIHLELQVPEHRLVISADRERALQVLANLVTNAIKFTPEDGSISLRVEPARGEVRFAVADTGLGIPADELPHVFGRYWKAEKGGRRGAGLGLYIAKGIVEASGGTIWVESRLGEGSTFFFTLPALEVGTRGPEPQTAHDEGTAVGPVHG